MNGGNTGEKRMNRVVATNETWRASLPEVFRGATRIEHLWHLYYGEKPSFAPGDTFNIVI
jgi:hypothetical protein